MSGVMPQNIRAALQRYGVVLVRIKAVAQQYLLALEHERDFPRGQIVEHLRDLRRRNGDRTQFLPLGEYRTADAGYDAVPMRVEDLGRDVRQRTRRIDEYFVSRSLRFADRDPVLRYDLAVAVYRSVNV